MYNRILVPTDGSAVSALAERAAIAFARANGSTVVALAIGQPYPPAVSAEGAMVIDPSVEAETLLAAAEANAARVAAAARAAGVDCTPVAAIAHSPSEAIIDHARHHGCDLIFMATSARRGLSRLLLGSVTEQVLAAAPVPVLVLRPEPTPARAAP
jgi:nucleotide-binding universal stress UspA family protein